MKEIAHWRDWTRFNRRQVLMVAGLVVLAPAVAAAQGSAGAEQFVSGLTEQAIALSRQVAANPTAHTVELTRLLDQSTDVRLVGRLVLGQQWRRLSEAQRQEYLGLFRDYVLAGLVRRLGGTKGVERVEVTGSRLVGNEDSMVSTRINLGNEGSPHNVEWRVRQGDAGYRIIDVVAEGVSLAVTTRNEFGAIVSQRGMDGLLAQLRERRALPSQQQPTA